MSPFLPFAWPKVSVIALFYLIIFLSLGALVNAQIDAFGLAQYARPLDLH